MIIDFNKIGFHPIEKKGSTDKYTDIMVSIEINKKKIANYWNIEHYEIILSLNDEKLIS